MEKPDSVRVQDYLQPLYLHPERWVHRALHRHRPRVFAQIAGTAVDYERIERGSGYLWCAGHSIVLHARPAHVDAGRSGKLQPLRARAAAAGLLICQRDARRFE